MRRDSKNYADGLQIRRQVKNPKHADNLLLPSFLFFSFPEPPPPLFSLNRRRCQPLSRATLAAQPPPRRQLHPRHPATPRHPSTPRHRATEPPRHPSAAELK
ncbi:hypothetical protein Drorol1_Dr00000629, partial [Drosera rotundifolia]